MPSPVRAEASRLPPPPSAAGEVVRTKTGSRLSQWIIPQPPDAVGPRGAGPRAATAGPPAGWRAFDLNRAKLREAIESHLHLLLRQRESAGPEVSGCLRAAINLSCDHADGWMRRTLSPACHGRALTSAELQEGLRRAEGYAEKLLTEADDHRLRALIFEEDDRPAESK
jgi:hypothetical protein